MSEVRYLRTTNHDPKLAILLVFIGRIFDGFRQSTRTRVARVVALRRRAAMHLLTCYEARLIVVTSKECPRC